MRGARVDVDTRDPVHVLGHHAGQHGHAQLEQAVRHPVHRDGLEPRIAVDDLVRGLGRRVAVEGGPDVRVQHPPDLREVRQHLQGRLVPAILTRAAFELEAKTLVADGAGDLLG